jgi:hypothetical protein
MHGVVGHFLGVHCRIAVLACVQSVGARYADIKGSEAVAASACQDVSRTQVSARDEPGRLHLCRWVAVLGHFEQLPRDRVVPPRGLGKAAAVSVRASGVEKLTPATPAGHWL